MPHPFSHIMVKEEHDIPNWILDESGHFILKLVRTFLLEPGVSCGWGKLIWSSFILPSKSIVLWKFFHEWLPIDQHIQNKGLHICSICTLCEKHAESILHLFFKCPNALGIWSWVREIFPTSHFSNKDGLLPFIKSDGSPLVSRAILVIKDLTYLVGNSSKAYMKNDMLDFNMIKFFGINTHTGKVLRPLRVRWEFSLPGWVKINTDGAARG